MPDTTEPFEVEATGEIYHIVCEEDEGTLRICVYSKGQLRFSLPSDIPDEQVRKFIQVYALGVADGQRATSIEGRLRTQLHNTAQRLGRAAASWKAEAK